MKLEERITQGIRDLIIVTGISQRKIASETGINSGQLSNFLRNLFWIWPGPLGGYVILASQVHSLFIQRDSYTAFSTPYK